MALDSSNASRSVSELNSLAATSISLLEKLESALLADGTDNTPQASPSESSPVPLDAFALAHDSATLIKAHSAKISLFIINEPFTPTAISKVLRDLVSGPIPALSSAVQSCDARRYTQLVRRHLALACYTVMKELRELIQRIPQDGRVLAGEAKHGSADIGRKGSIIATGTLWSACDAVVGFATTGIQKHLVQKAQALNDDLKDVMDELKDWGDEVPSDAEEDEGLPKAMAEPSDSPSSSAQDMLDQFMSSHKTIPAEDPDRIRERLETCLGRLRLTTLLYQAIIKRRLKSLPPLPTSEPSGLPQRLDELFTILRQIPDRYCDLAAAFYDLNAGEIDVVMDQCVFDACAASDLVLKPFEGKPDAFTTWAEKFQIEIRKK